MTPTDTPDRVAQIVAWLRRKAERMDRACERQPDNRLVPDAQCLAAIYRQNADAIEAGEPFKDKT